MKMCLATTFGNFPRTGVFLVVAACAVFPWITALHYPLLHDDNMAVVNNPLVDGKAPDIAGIFTSTGWGDIPEYRHVANYRPIATTTLAVTRYLNGLDPFLFRATNVVLYVITCLLLLRLMFTLGASPLAAGLAGAWFALHGTHVETVMFAVNREILIATSFYLLGLNMVIARSGLVDRPRSWSAASGAVLGITALAGMLSKESAVTMPFVAAAIILLARPAEGRVRDTVTPLVVLGLAAGAYFIIRIAAIGHLTAAAIPWQDNPLVLSDTSARLAGAMSLVLLALRLLILPSNMTVDYGFDVLGLPGRPPGAPVPEIAAGLLILVSAAALLVFLIRRKSRAWPGLLMMAVTWGLVSSIVFPSWIIMGERLLTEPSAGLALSGAVGLTVLTRSGTRARGRTRFFFDGSRLVRTGAVALVLLWISVMCVLSVDRISDYKSAESLFKSSLANRPGSTRLHNNVGKAMMDTGRWAEAEPWLKAAIAIDPANAEAHNNLGLVLGSAGMPGSAAAEFQEALRHRPNMPAALTNLCILLSNNNSCESAIPVCEQALSRGGDVSRYIDRCRHPAP